MTDVTQILSQIEQGDSSAADQLLPLVYEELTELHPNVDYFGISPDGKRVVGTVHERGACRTLCWDPESRTPLREQLGGSVSFGNRNWVVTHSYGGRVRIHGRRTSPVEQRRISDRKD